MIRKRLALIGFPNTGKSTFFNRLTGLSQRVGNWPGLTVEFNTAKLLLGQYRVDLYDFPGIHDLSGFSEDEKLVQTVLTESVFDGIVIILNATQIDRQLHLVLQLKKLHLPMLLLLNMSDEAKDLGIQIDVDRLSEKLDLSVVLMAAKRGENWPRVQAALLDLLAKQTPHDTPDLRDGFQGFDETLICQKNAILEETYHTQKVMPQTLSNKIDEVLMHPWFGLPIFFIAMGIMFQLVFRLGEPLQDVIEEFLVFVGDSLITPNISALPEILQGFITGGIWEGVVTILTFLPIIFVFYIVMGFIEDCGYLSRAAFLMDRFMSKLGLDGRCFVMHLMGFGCSVPALMGTRIMRDRKLRLLSMLTIPFSLCAARLQVFLFFTTLLFSPSAAPFVLLSLYLLSLLVAMFNAFLFKGTFKSSDLFALEIPRYRLPTFRQIFTRASLEAKAFLKSASTYILVGVIAVWMAMELHVGASGKTVAETIADLFEPLFTPIGIPKELSLALLSGLVAKEVVIGALSVIYGVGQEGLEHIVKTRIDWVSGYAFMIFVLIYTPCFATLSVMKKESKSILFTLFFIVWSSILAWVASFFFYQGARILGF